MENMKERLAVAAKALNAVVYENEEKDEKTPLIKTKIKIVAVKEEVLKQAFKDACESIPEELESFIPDEVADLYNELFGDDASEGEGTAEEGECEAEQGEAEEAPEPSPKDKKKAAPPAKPAPAKPEKKASGRKAPTPPKREKDALGNVVGTMSATINALLIKGAKKADIVAAIMKNHDKDEDAATNKLLGHVKWLKTEKGLVISYNEKTEVYKLQK